MSTPCHHTNQSIFKIGKSRIIPGGVNDYGRYIPLSQKQLGLTLCLNKHSEFTLDTLNFKKVGTGAAKSFALLQPYGLDAHPGEYYATVNWPDGGTVSFPREFWEQIIAFIRDLEGKDVYVHCIGGHGRTGTALAILAHLSKAKPKDVDPVLWVREKYCALAVETSDQLNYIEDITGVQVTDELPKRTFTPSAPGGYKGAVPTPWATTPVYPAAPVLKPYPSSDNYFPPNFLPQQYGERDIPVGAPQIMVPEGAVIDATMLRLRTEIEAIDKRMIEGDEVAAEQMEDVTVYLINKDKGYRTSWGTPIHRDPHIALAMLDEVLYAAQYHQF